jgi:CRP/FNR family cyclic AMP-dependent transcriptional regulator
VEPHKTGTESAPDLEEAAFEKFLADLPLATYSAGEAVITAGSKSGRLLILKKGAVAILMGSTEIARVTEPGAVLGEISALLDQPHGADVRTLEDSEFYIADAALLRKDPIAVFHVARILAQRLVAADAGLAELKNQIQAGHSPDTIGKLIMQILRH